jgi:small neutral amino acid transporter SnatA (MarC family)
MEYCLQRLRDADIPKDTFVNIHRLSSFAAAGSWFVHVFGAQMHRFEMNGSE